MNFMFQHLDNKLFELINQKWINPIFDLIMIWFSQVKNWYLFYFILVAFIYFKRRNEIWRWIIVSYLNIFLIVIYFFTTINIQYFYKRLFIKPNIY